MDQTRRNQVYAGRLLSAFVKYALTWKAVLLKPDEFARVPLNKRKQQYTSPYAFLSISLLLLNYLNTIATWALARFGNTPGPGLNLRSLADPSTLSAMLPAVVSTGIQAFLWWVVLHKWLAHQLTVRTSTPFRRIFQELLYVNAPIAVLSTVGILLGLAMWAVITAAALFAIAILGSGATKIFVGPILIVYVIATLLLIPGPLILPGLFYNTCIAEALFRIPRSRAIKLCLIFSLFSALPMTWYRFHTNSVLPQQLSHREKRAVRDVQCLRAFEAHYYDTEAGEVLPISKISAYTRSIPDDDAWKTTHRKDISVLLQFTSERLDGYVFSIEPSRGAGMIHGNPELYGGLTKYSFAAEIEGQNIHVADNGGRNANAEDRVLLVAAQIDAGPSRNQ